MDDPTRIVTRLVFAAIILIVVITLFVWLFAISRGF